MYLFFCFYVSFHRRRVHQVLVRGTPRPTQHADDARTSRSICRRSFVHHVDIPRLKCGDVSFFLPPFLTIVFKEFERLCQSLGQRRLFAAEPMELAGCVTLRQLLGVSKTVSVRELRRRRPRPLLECRTILDFKKGNSFVMFFRYILHETMGFTELSLGICFLPYVCVLFFLVQSVQVSK